MKRSVPAAPLQTAVEIAVEPTGNSRSRKRLRFSDEKYEFPPPCGTLVLEHWEDKTAYRLKNQLITGNPALLPALAPHWHFCPVWRSVWKILPGARLSPTQLTGYRWHPPLKQSSYLLLKRSSYPRTISILARPRRCKPSATRRAAAGLNVPIWSWVKAGRAKKFCPDSSTIARLGDGPIRESELPGDSRTLIESELFGFQKGAFTGAQPRNPAAWNWRRAARFPGRNRRNRC